MTQAEIEELFTYHSPEPHQIPTFVKIREEAKHFALIVSEITPASAEQTLAIRAIHAAVFHANTAVALHGKKH